MNKLTKILSAIALASAVSAGMVLMAGCEGCSDTTTPPPGGEQHEHTYSPDWSYDENNHWHAATCEHSDLKSDEAAHVDANNDGVCDVCGYDQMPITPYAVGIEMTKTAKEYVLDGSTTAAVALDDIKVNTVLSDGTDGETVTEYAMYGYKGAEPLQAEGKTLTAADVSALGAGAYNIWVEAEIDSNGTNKKVESFVIVYVVDELISIQFNADAAGTVTTQEAGTTDLMSPTWTFTATFKSGATLPLTADDVKINNVKTTSATDAGVANIYYEYTNAKGELEKQETTVNYTVTTPPPSGDEPVEGVYNVSDATLGNITENTTIIDQLGLTVTALATTDKATVIDASAKSIDGFSFTQRMKLGGTGTATYYSLKIEVENAATVTVYGMSGKSGVERTLGLYDSAFTLIDDTQSNNGEAIAKLTYTIDEAGTYYLASTNSGFNIYYISVVMEGGESGEGGEGGETIENVVLNLGTHPNYSALSSSNKTATLDAGTEILAGSGISTIGSTDYTVEYSSKKVVDTEISYNVRLKFGGAINFTEQTNGLKIATQDAATITVYVRSSSSSADRTVALYDEDQTQIGTYDFAVTQTGDYIYVATFTVSEMGIYYFGSTSGGIGIYAVEINYGA